MITALEALERLRAGNVRFEAGVPRGNSLNSTLRAEMAEVQEPFAVILGCSDSRVPPELVFDQRLGDLFVIRVAGNIASPSQLGSVELAAVRLGVRLVVVLGHSRCAAILATLEELTAPTEKMSTGLRAIVDCVRPAVAPLLVGDHAADPDAIVRDAVRRNIRASVEELRSGSPAIQREIQDEGLLVVGAEYSLETGIVEFLD